MRRAAAAWLLLAAPLAALPAPARAAEPSSVRLEVPEVVRLDGGSLGERRSFESSPIRLRLRDVRVPSGRTLVVRLAVAIDDDRWGGSELAFAAASVRGGIGLAGPLLPGVATPVFRTTGSAGDAEVEIVLRVRAPARRLGAGPRALRLEWDLSEEDASGAPQAPAPTPAATGGDPTGGASSPTADGAPGVGRPATRDQARSGERP